ncbi:MAG: D-2-hydroxyacid dehydrogenase [Alteromonadaceae bacterium]|nr:D-2-hydroxyacid dehydrogenase [Alteromonadaceae bacterium]
MHTVFLDQQTFNNNISLAEIKNEVSTLTCYETTRPNEIIDRCLDAEIIITNKVVLCESLLKQLPKLKLICVAATGMNNIDLVAAKALNIEVTNVSGYASQSVAQYVFAQILELFNQTSHHNQNTESGLWAKSPTFCYLGNNINELAGKTLGIIGYGVLGKAVSKIAEAFGMNVLIAERANAENIRSNRTSYQQVIKTADVLTLHCPQTPETEQMVNKEFLQMMQPHSTIINTARGALVDNSALLNALKNNEIAYAVLDVLDQEPPPADHPLICSELDNLKITAHIAWASTQAQQKLISGISKNINAFRNR